MANESEAHRFTIDPAADPTVDIIQAVSEVTGRDPLSGPPLTETVDVDALSRLLDGPAPVAVTFRYADCEIRVDSGGHLRVRDAGDEITVVR